MSRGTQYVFEHASQAEHITVHGSPKAIYKAAEDLRAKAAEAGEAPPKWAQAPGECKLVKTLEEERAATPAAAQAAPAGAITPDMLAEAFAKGIEIADARARARAEAASKAETPKP
jgi:hypothetical protein